jgi:serine/threonine-protein kinase
VSDAVLRDRLVAAVGDRYEVREEVGRGGMAVVYHARDVRLNRSVAIKLLPPELAYRADIKARFLREAETAAGLTHPHIVPIHTVDEQQGLVFFVMGYVAGESLGARLARGALPLAEARRILAEVADALAYAHAHGVVHRDVKPDNILLDATAGGRAMVTDFGIARAAEGDQKLTVTGIAVGTPTYMSPEQALGESDVDGRADIYALGVVAYQVFAGTPPFTAANTPAMLMKHIGDPPPPLAAARGDLPPGVVHAVERALAKRREQRWPDALAFRDALLADEAPVAVAGRAAEAPGGPGRGVDRAPSPLPALPPYPKWPGASADDRARWREAQRRWRDQVRAQQSEWRAAWQEQARAMREQTAAAGGRSRKERDRDKPVDVRLTSVRRHMVSWAGMSAMFFTINAVTGGFPWFVFPVMGMGVGVLTRVGNLWADGIPVRWLFRRGPYPALPGMPAGGAPALAAGAAAAADRPDPPVAPGLLVGRRGLAVRRAWDDVLAVQDTVARLAPADRGQLPDVMPTVQALFERVTSLAAAVTRLDDDVTPAMRDRLALKVAEAEAQPAGADRDRRLALLARQQATLGDLAARHAELDRQFEHATLVLGTLRLDVLKLRSAGIDSALGEVTSVTQEARALSRDIGRVLEAAEEVRKI